MPKISKLSPELRGNPFRDYQLPQAIIMLRQGFGRLMRGRRDYGVVAILDPRLRTRYYGKAFFASLPGSRVTSRLSHLKEFIDRMRVDNEGRGTTDEGRVATA